MLILAVLVCSTTGRLHYDLWPFRIANIIANFILCRITDAKHHSFLCASLFNKGYNLCSMCLVWKDNLMEAYFLPFTNQTWLINSESNHRELREMLQLSYALFFPG